MISIDDFGIGYSSLSRFKQYDVDSVKIDKLFIDGIGSSRIDEELIKGIIRIAAIRGALVIAEGVETKEQVDFLIENSCDEIQGYYYARAMEIEKVESFIKDYYV